MNHESPVINGDGSYSRDFTYIDNVISMNLLCLTTDNQKALNQVYNSAVGKRTTLVELTELIKKNLLRFDQSISSVEIFYGPNRKGDIPHSLASVEKAKQILGYKASHSVDSGIKDTLRWYLAKLKN